MYLVFIAARKSLPGGFLFAEGIKRTLPVRS